MCCTIQAIFVLCVIYMFIIVIVCDDKNALLWLGVFYWLHVYIIIIIKKIEVSKLETCFYCKHNFKYLICGISFQLV
jgi:hypothetical protein